MKSAQDRVRQFHMVFGHPVEEVPINIADLYEQIFTLGNGKKLAGHQLLMGRAAFHIEEAAEFMEACSRLDTSAAVDALVDLIVFALGTLTILGVDAETVFNVVMDANMEKAQVCSECKGSGEEHGIEGYEQRASSCWKCKGHGKVVAFREDGKVQKPDDWKHPDIAELLARMTQVR